MPKATLFFILFFGLNQIVAQKWGANTFSQFSNEAMDVEIDNVGNAYITGYVTGETAFSISNVIQNTSGNGDIYVAKYGPNGDLIWVKKFGGNYSDRAFDLAIGPDQNIVITGQFFGSVTFGSTTLQSTLNSKDIFLAKLAPNGSVIWALKEGGSMAENAYGVTVDHQNNVILTGQFQGDATIAGSNFTSDVDPITNLPSFDLFVSKYDPSGSPLWAKVGAAKKEDRGLAVAVDSQDNIFFTGQYSDTIIFDGITYNCNGYNVGFISKISPAGQVQFLNNLRAGFVLPYDVEVNSTDKVVITGDFSGNMNYYHNTLPTVIQNPFSRKIFILTIENDGSYTWNYTLGSDNDISSTSVSIDPDDNVFVTGFFSCALNQLHDSVPALWNSVGFKDPYVLKVSEHGNFIYAKQMGGKMDDVGHGIAIQSTDKPIICGGFTLSLNVAPTADLAVISFENNYQLRQYNNEISQYYFSGDSTRNSFLLKYINDDYPDYNFYFSQTSDSLFGNINNDIDTLHFCSSKIISYNTLTWEFYGPSYHFLWNTSEIEQSIIVNLTGDYSVIVARDDGCATDVDSIYLIKDPQPNLPLLSDDVIQYTNHEADFSGNYGNYNLCFPNPITVNFTNLDPGTTLSVSDPVGNLVQGIDPRTYSLAGDYQIVVDNGMCQKLGYFDLLYNTPFLYDTIDPTISSTSAFINNAISICAGETVNFYAYDTISNPLGIVQPLQEHVVDSYFTINGLNYFSSEYYFVDFSPESSGFYLVEYDIILGYDNSCGLDTMHFHAQNLYYIDVIPLPNFTTEIVGDDLLCENGSILLTTTNSNSNLSWSGPGILWESIDYDSIEVNQPGYYFYAGELVDSISGCMNSFVFSKLITLKEAPFIELNPSDGIICPNDTIFLSLPTNYLNYEWVGPEGDTVSDVFICAATTQGYYYCHVLDQQGCYLTTEPYEVKEYSSPSISVLPQTFMCEQEPVTISVNYSGQPSFQWSPIGGTADQIIVNSPGVYSVSIQQCGFTFMDSITIVDASFNPIISTSDTLICNGEVLTLLGNINNASYQWSNGDFNSGTLTVDQVGNYFATVTNAFGCSFQSNTISIGSDTLSFVPFVFDTAICVGTDIILRDTSLNIINWYSQDTALIETSNQISILGVMNDTSFIYSQLPGGCNLNFQTVHISIVDSIINLEIIGDSILCPNEQTYFHVGSNETVTWSTPTQNLGSTDVIYIDQTSLQNSQIITVNFSNQCFSGSSTDSIFYIQPDSISFELDSILICKYDTIQLTVQEEVSNITWNGNFGSLNGLNLPLSSSFGNGEITATAIDLNGCITNSVSVMLTVSGLDFSISSDSTNDCFGNESFIQVSTNADSLIWNTPNGITDTTYISYISNSKNSGNYQLSVWDTLGCRIDTTIGIGFHPLPIFNLDSDTLLCLNEIYTHFFPTDTNNYSWSIYGSNTDIPIAGNQELILIATSPAGCVYTDTIFVIIVNCDDGLPNIITANGDGINDYLVIDEAELFPNNELTIYNRWGEEMFNQKGYLNTFAGENISDGVYWYVFYQDPFNEPKKLKHGFLHIYH